MSRGGGEGPKLQQDMSVVPSYSYSKMAVPKSDRLGLRQQLAQGYNTLDRRSS